MIYILKILFFYINFTIFTFTQTRFIFHNIKDNFFYQGEYNNRFLNINEYFINNKIEYYKKCYEYINNVPADVKFKDYDKENAKNHLIIAFCKIEEQGKDREGKDLKDLNYKIEFDINDISNKNDIDNEISTDDGKNKIDKNTLKFELTINRDGVLLKYINKTNNSEFKTEKIDNKKWALFELKTNDDEIEIEVNKTKKKYNLTKSTKYLFVSDINSQLKYESCFKKKEKDKNQDSIFEDRHYGLFEYTYNKDISIIFCDTKNIKKLNRFFLCENLETVNNFELMNTENVTNMTNTFSASKLKNINLTELNTKNVKYMDSIFHNVGLEKIEFGKNFKTDKVKSILFAFTHSKIKKIDLSKLNFSNIKYILNLFTFCDNLEEVNMSNMNLENIKDMSMMFQWCKKLKKINFDNTKFRDLENISALFSYCESLEKIDLSFLNNLKIEHMSSLFFSCTNLKEIIFGDNFDTSNVETMDSMFSICKSLKVLDLTRFNTSKVKTMYGMFAESNIEELILPDNFVPKNCETQLKDNNSDRTKMFGSTKISTFKVNGKTLPKNLSNYELFTKYTDKYLKYGDKLNLDGSISKTCCCCCNNCCNNKCCNIC